MWSVNFYVDYYYYYYFFLRMTILSSREYTCIQNTTKNKTELCNELLDTAKVCVQLI